MRTKATTTCTAANPISNNRIHQASSSKGLICCAHPIGESHDNQPLTTRVPSSTTVLFTSPIARKREMAFLAKQMRKRDDEELDAIRDALDANSEGSRRQVAQMHRAENWRTRLLEGGDDALAALPEGQSFSSDSASETTFAGATGGERR